jgi:hypothetical protein
MCYEKFIKDLQDFPINYIAIGIICTFFRALVGPYNMVCILRKNKLKIMIQIM